jgi:hypothetical protein
MPGGTFRVFVSSTSLDLQPERKAVEAVLNRIAETKLVGMEYFGSRDETTRQASLAEVDGSHLFICIVGGRYGSGITEAEYRHAIELRLPCLIYCKPDDQVVPEWKEADPVRQARLERLKAALRKTHTVTTFANPDNLAALVTADLHRWIVENHLQPLARSAAKAYSLEAWRELAERIGASGIWSPGAAAFAMFAGGPAALARRIRVEDFRSLVEERTQGFVGREFILKAIADALADPHFPSGYVIVKGEPGIGKTSLMAELVRRHGWVHHLNIAALNIQSPRDFLASVSAQLILNYRLDHDGLPPEAETDGGFLARLLDEAVWANAGAPVVVLVDALDEAADTGLAPNANRLFLPPVLPAGAFFVVTMREKFSYRLSVDRSKSLYLRDNDPQNLADVAEYIRRFVGQFRDPMERRMTDWKIAPEAFVDAMTEKSQGNFMYLVHVLRDIREGRLTAQNIDSVYDLPDGLKEYYQHHWSTMHAAQPERFETYHVPVLCTLAAAREPVPLTQLVEWTRRNGPRSTPPPRWLFCASGASFSTSIRSPAGRPAIASTTPASRTSWPSRLGLRCITTRSRNRPSVKSLGGPAREACRDPGLVPDADAGCSYAEAVADVLTRLVRHVTLADSPALRKDSWALVYNPGAAGPRRAAGPARQFPTAHRYGVPPGGDGGSCRGGARRREVAAMTPAAGNPLDGLNEYELRHLPGHLLEAGRDGDLHRLLSTETAAGHNAWYEAKDLRIGTADYVADVRQARTAAAGTPFALRYGLILASVNSRAGNLTPEMVTALAERGLWKPERAMAYARRTPDAEQRCKTMTRVARIVPADAAEWLDEALAAARAVADAQVRAHCLVAMLADWPGGRPRRLLEAILENAGTAEVRYERTHAAYPLHQAARNMDVPMLEKAQEILASWGESLPLRTLMGLAGKTKAIDVEGEIAHRERALAAKPEPRELASFAAAMAGAMPPARYRRLVKQAFRAAMAGDDRSFRHYALVDVIPHLAQRDRARAVREVLDHVRQQKQDFVSVHMLGRLAEAAPPEFHGRIVAAAARIADENGRGRALARVCPAVDGMYRVAAVDGILALAAGPRGEGMAERIEEVARYFSADQRARAAAIARGWKGRSRVRDLAALAGAAPVAEREALVADALAALPEMRNDPQFAIARLAPLMSAERLKDMLALVERIDDAMDWVRSLPRLAERLPAQSRAHAWRLAVRVTDGLEREWLRVEVMQQMASMLPISMNEELLGVATGFEQTVARAETLAAIAPRFEGPKGEHVVEQAMREAEALDSTERRVECFARLAGCSTERRASLVARVRHEMAALQASEATARVLLMLALLVPQDEFDRWLIEEVQRADPRPDRRRVIIETLAPVLSAEAVRELAADDAAAGALLARLAQLGHVSEAVHMAQELPGKDEQMVALAALAPYLPEDVLESAYDETVTMSGEEFRSPVPVSRARRPGSSTTLLSDSAREYLLAGLCPWAAKVGWRPALNCALELRGESWRAEALVRLLPHVPVDELPSALRAALAAIRRIRHERKMWLPLWAEALARLNRPQAMEMLAAALDAAAEEPRASLIETVCCLAPGLAMQEGFVAPEVLAGIDDAVRWWP